MPVNFLGDAKRLRFNSVPANLSAEDLIAFFTLSETDLQQIPTTASVTNRMGFALQLVLLRFLDFHLIELKSLPETVINFASVTNGNRSRTNKILW